MIISHVQCFHHYRARGISIFDNNGFGIAEAIFLMFIVLRAPGGGQKRKSSYSAVRVMHEPRGLTVRAEESVASF